MSAVLAWAGQYWCEILIISFIPLLFGSIAFTIWRDHRRQMKLENNPHRMNEGEYINFNRGRFNK
jgi:hypothetical protein